MALKLDSNRIVKTVNYSLATIANAATVDSGNIATKGDDQVRRRVIGILSSDHTANVRTQIAVQSKQIHDIDDSCFSPTYGPLELDHWLEPGQYLDVQIFNNSGGSINNISVTIWYEVAQL